MTALVLGYALALVGLLVHWWQVSGYEMAWLDVDRLEQLPEPLLRAKAEGLKITQRRRQMTAIPLIAVGVLLVAFGVWCALTAASLESFLVGFLSLYVLGAGVQFYWWTRVNPPVNPFALHLGELPPQL